MCAPLFQIKYIECFSFLTLSLGIGHFGHNPKNDVVSVFGVCFSFAFYIVHSLHFAFYALCCIQNTIDMKNVESFLWKIVRMEEPCTQFHQTYFTLYMCINLYSDVFFYCA